MIGISAVCCLVAEFFLARIIHDMIQLVTNAEDMWVMFRLMWLDAEI